MRLRISVKALLGLVAAAAVGCGWYAAQAAERNRELAAIARLGDLGGELSVQGSGYVWCGHFNGAKVQLEDRTPRLLRPVAGYFDIDVCHRVDSVVLIGVTGTDYLAALSDFQQLKAVSFYPGDLRPTFDEAETFCHQLKLYAALHPQIKVDYPSDLAELYRPRFDPSDPFADPEDPFAHPELGMDVRTTLEVRRRAADGARPLFSSDDLVADPFALAILREQAVRSTGVTREILQYAVTRLEETHAER